MRGNNLYDRWWTPPAGLERDARIDAEHETLRADGFYRPDHNAALVRIMRQVFPAHLQREGLSGFGYLGQPRYAWFFRSPLHPDIPLPMFVRIVREELNRERWSGGPDRTLRAVMHRYVYHDLARMRSLVALAALEESGLR